LGIRGSFSLELAEMLIEELVCDGDHPVVPTTPLATLVAADEEDRSSSRIEGKQDADIATRRNEFFHVLVSGLSNGVHQRTAQAWPSPLKNIDGGRDGFLLLFGEVAPPITELVSVLDIPVIS
jgi:hypothetical protein